MYHLEYLYSTSTFKPLNTLNGAERPPMETCSGGRGFQSHKGQIFSLFSFAERSEGIIWDIFIHHFNFSTTTSIFHVILKITALQNEDEESCDI